MLPYVLIHGAGDTGKSWEQVIAHLRHPFLAVDLPGRNDKPGDLDTLTVRDFAASVVDDMNAAAIDRAVIVGHSLAGLTLVTLAELIPERIAHLVFVNSVVPPHGKGNFDVVGKHVRQMVETYGVGADQRSLHPEALRHHHCNDLDEAQTREVMQGGVSEARKPLHRPISLTGLREHPIPCTWILGTIDLAVPPDTQRHSIANLAGCGCSVDVIEIEAGHLITRSRPKALAELLDAVDQVGETVP